MTSSLLAFRTRFCSSLDWRREAPRCWASSYHVPIWRRSHAAPMALPPQSTPPSTLTLWTSYSAGRIVKVSRGGCGEQMLAQCRPPRSLLDVGRRTETWNSVDTCPTKHSQAHSWDHFRVQATKSGQTMAPHLTNDSSLLSATRLG